MRSLQKHEYLTPSGVVVEHERTRLEARAALDALTRALDRRRGVLLACNYEVPGRYVRRTVGFTDPPIALESRGMSFELSALNARGELLRELLLPALSATPDLLVHRDGTRLHGHVAGDAAAAAEERRTQRPSVLSAVRALARALASPHEQLLGLYGAFGYDLVFQFEALTRSRSRRGERELVLYLPDELLVWDGVSAEAERHRFEFRASDGSRARTTHGLARQTADQPFHRAPFAGPTGDHAPGAFVRAVREAKRAFERGDLFEVTLSQTFRRPFEESPSALFTRLSRESPAPFGLFVNLGEGEFLVGASPEMYVRVRGATVESCPIAGTIARGDDALGDAAHIQALLNSAKDEAELTMCTDVDRNDKARICEPGSVCVVGRRQVELHTRLIHTVDHVRGTLREGYDALDALLTHMWSVTVTGAPKLDAMQFIEAHEATPRGFYGGAVGFVGFDGSLDTGLTLRTAHLRRGVAEVRAGATLLYDSDPEAEERESELKASALLAALTTRASKHADGVPPAGRPFSSAPQRELRVLLIDHRDSFVHMLGDYFRQARCHVTTLRHGFAPEELDRLKPELVVLSPGPRRPGDFAMDETLRRLAGRAIPVFGVCLGLQGMVEFAGGTLTELPVPCHGKAARMTLATESSPLFRGFPRECRVGRYHSLAAERESLPSSLEILAEAADDGCVMAVAHRHYPWYAVQFHPESILSSGEALGLRLIGNVVELALGQLQTSTSTCGR